MTEKTRPTFVEYGYGWNVFEGDAVEYEILADSARQAIVTVRCAFQDPSKFNYEAMRKHRGMFVDTYMVTVTRNAR